MEREYEVKFWVRATEETPEAFESIEQALHRFTDQYEQIEGLNVYDKDVVMIEEWE